MEGFLPFTYLVPIILLVGIMIGSIGIGGVLLVPALTYLAGIDIHVAIAACMLSYAFSGSIGAWIYAKRGTIRWQTGVWLCLGAMPGAYFGALVVSYLPTRAITLVIAVFVVVAGLQAMYTPRESLQKEPALEKTVLILLGVVVGFGSALSGTGGPLLLVPLLVWFNWPVLVAVGLSQIIQLPISALATLGNYLHGEVDVFLGLRIAAIMILGVAAGAQLAHRLPALLLRRIVALALCLVGIAMLRQTL